MFGAQGKAKKKREKTHRRTQTVQTNVIKRNTKSEHDTMVQSKRFKMELKQINPTNQKRAPAIRIEMNALTIQV